MTITDPVFRSCDTFTPEQFARWVETISPTDHHRYELLNGSIVREPPAGWPHGTVGARISSRCERFVRRRRLGLVFDSSQGFELPSGDTVEPDVSFVSTTRWQTLPKPVHGYPRVAPDLIFEVLSPSTRRLDETEKKAIYAKNGVREYLLVDAAARTIRQLIETNGRYDAGATFTGSDVYRSVVLAGLNFRVADVMAED